MGGFWDGRSHGWESGKGGLVVRDWEEAGGKWWHLGFCGGFSHVARELLGGLVQVVDISFWRGLEGRRRW